MTQLQPGRPASPGKFAGAAVTEIGLTVAEGAEVYAQLAVLMPLVGGRVG